MAEFDLPNGYQVTTVAHYPGGMSPFGKQLGYEWAMAAEKTAMLKGGIPKMSFAEMMSTGLRATGQTQEEAFAELLRQAQAVN